MAQPQLPFELFQRIIRTSRYLERAQKLHDSQLWQSVRWYTGNGDVTVVPQDWGANLWFKDLVRALFDPSVRNIHLKTVVLGTGQNSIWKVHQLVYLLRLKVIFHPFAPARNIIEESFLSYNYPRRSARNARNAAAKTVTHGDVRYLPSYL